VDTTTNIRSAFRLAHAFEFNGVPLRLYEAHDRWFLVALRDEDSKYMSVVADDCEHGIYPRVGEHPWQVAYGMPWDHLIQALAYSIGCGESLINILERRYEDIR
jgi:hypothetical protein